MANPTKFTWVDPTTNTDGTAITAGEITGYNIGIRSTTKAGSVAGTYPIQVPVSGPTAASEMLASITPVLAVDSYAAAIQSVGPVSSVFSGEVTFDIVPPVPNPPQSFTVS
jgi:hypothetical protein